MLILIPIVFILDISVIEFISRLSLAIVEDCTFPDFDFILFLDYGGGALLIFLVYCICNHFWDFINFLCYLFLIAALLLSIYFECCEMHLNLFALEVFVTIAILLYWELRAISSLIRSCIKSWRNK